MGVPKRTNAEVAREHCLRINKLPVSEERRAKLSARMSLENNPQWRGGKSYEPYTTEFNESKRNEIRNSYGNKCFVCGEISNGKKLCVHHIDYNKTNSNESNLVPLCHGCHGVTTANRRAWTMFFYLNHGGINGTVVN